MVNDTPMLQNPIVSYIVYFIHTILFVRSYKLFTLLPWILSFCIVHVMMVE
jgi:hypothetical protein